MNSELDDAELVNCYACNGDGRYFDYDRYWECEVCYGSGCLSLAEQNRQLEAHAKWLESTTYFDKDERHD